MTNNYTAEQSVVGAILIDARCVPDVLRVVKADDFRPGINQDIMVAVTQMYAAGAVMDAVTIIGSVQRNGSTYSDDVERYAREVMNLTPTAENVLEYARIVKESAQRRKIADLADEISESARFGENVADALSAALTGFQALEAEGTAKVTAGPDAVKDFRAWVEAVRKDPEHAVVRTRFHYLDVKLGGGLVKTGLYIIGARPGMGKTTVALNLATNIANAGKRVLFVSLEMDKTQITTKRISIWSYLPFTALYNGRISNADTERLARTLDRIEQMPFDVIDEGIGNVADLAAFLQIRRDYDVVFVDYLGILSPAADDLQKPRYEQITNISADLKRLAKRTGIPIIALSQLNRESKNKRPTLAELRDSGAIEQDADGVILLYREGYGTDDPPPVEDIEFIIAKNRHGETGTVKLTWHGPSGRVYEKSNREET